MQLTKRPFGRTPAGEPVELYTLVNGPMSADICTYGGIVVRLAAPGRDGVSRDVVLGYDDLDGYLADQCYFGCLVGRVANRIGRARFTLDGVEYEVDRNHGAHHLHGGRLGFHARVWRAEPGGTDAAPSLTLTYDSADGEQGYPGALSVRATYTLEADGLRLEFAATTDKTTVVNLTNHSYFNLSGRPGSDCLGHVLTIPAHRYLETDAELIPTGNLAELAGTPLDFAAGVAIGQRIRQDSLPLSIGKGYDHCYVLDGREGAPGNGLRLAASAAEPVSGRTMEVWTDHPCVQFYSGNHIPAGLPGKGGAVYGPRAGFCLEAQEYVDAPNHDGFPEVTLEPGIEHRRTILFRFFVK